MPQSSANTPSANTPDPPNPISFNDVKRVFGKGLDLRKHDDLNDFHGVGYWDTTYPYAAGKFNATLETQLSLQDFYSKSAIDPVVPGKLEDYQPGGPRYVEVPPFRKFVVIDLWGAGGGGGAGDHDGTPPPGGNGGASTFSITIGGGTFSLTSNGGGGGTGGYRYGNQNGSGGGGGGTTSSGTIIGNRFYNIGGSSGSGGDAGNGRGGNGGSAPYGGAGGPRGGSREGSGNPIDGKPGFIPGGGGGGGGSSDFQSGKNANPNRAAGGGGGSGSYQRLYLTRSQITPKTRIVYSVGAGGAGSIVPRNRSLGNGGSGASGGFRLFYDRTETPIINYQKILINDWAYHFGGCFGAGYNDLTLHVSTSIFTINGRQVSTIGGIILSVTGAAADYTVASPGYAGRWSSAGHTSVTDPNYYYNSGVMLADTPFQNHTSGWWSAYAAGRDNMAFRTIAQWDGTRGILSVTVQGDCKGGKHRAYDIATVYPTISWSGIP